MSSAENGKPAGRLVWMRDEQRALLREAIFLTADSDLIAQLADYATAYDGAPIEPAEAVRGLITTAMLAVMPDPIAAFAASETVTDTVLQALGVPSPTHTEGQ